MIENIRSVLLKIQTALELPEVHLAVSDGKILIQDSGFNVLMEIDIVSKELILSDNLPHTKHSVKRTFKMNGIHLN